ncbi:lytic transglycosylase domain-containing protein [Actinomadura alba]
MRDQEQGTRTRSRPVEPQRGSRGRRPSPPGQRSSRRKTTNVRSERRERRPRREPGDPGVLRRILTHTVTIMSLVTVALVAAVIHFSPGGGEPPPAAGDMSANELVAMMTRSEMSPIEAAAVANAKKRAHEEQVRAERIAKEKAKRDAKIRAQQRARARASASAAALAKLDTSPARNKAIGKQMNALKGWARCWPSLETMWTRESGWNERADNPTSDAYGIPQSLPGSKMASAGSDWQTNAATQIAWGLGYIKARYGDPCKAWGFWQANHWY